MRVFCSLPLAGERQKENNKWPLKRNGLWDALKKVERLRWLQRRTTGDEPQEVEWPAGGKGGGIVQKELNETVVRSREEIDERLETEDRQQLGDISDEVIQLFSVLSKWISQKIFFELLFWWKFPWSWSIFYKCFCCFKEISFGLQKYFLI